MQSDVAHLADLLVARAERSPDNIGYTFLSDDLTVKSILTYAQLHQRAKVIATALRAWSLPGDRVLLSLGHGPDFVATFFACLYAGVIAVPIKPIRTPSDEWPVGPIAEDCGATIGIISAGSVLHPPSSDHKSHAPTLRWLAVETLDQFHEASITDPIGRGNSEIAYLQYTSGSTENPRGVIISHKNVLSNLAAIDADFRHSSESVGATWLPHFHDMGLVYGLLQPIYNGYPCYVLAPEMFARYPLSWLRAISRFRVTHSGAPNFGYDYCVRRARQGDIDRLDLSSWRVAFNGAEKVRRETLRRFASRFAQCGFDGLSFYAAYGLAEATLKVSGGFCGAAVMTDAACDQEKRGAEEIPCGWPDTNTRVLIVDPTSCQQVPDGKEGELWVQGPSVASGYWRSSSGEGTTFGGTLNGDEGALEQDQRYLRTGDIGFWGEHGLIIAGRLKAVIVIRGRSYHAEDIEASVAHSVGFGRMANVCAFSVDSEGEERLVIMVAWRNRQDSELPKITDEIRRLLAFSYGLQAHVVAFADSLPKTSSGKIQRHGCKALFMSGDSSVHAKIVLDEADDQTEIDDEAFLPQGKVDESNEDEIHKQILTMISSALQLSVSSLHIQTPLSSSGADSLGTLALSYSLEERFGVEITPEELFEASPSAICARIFERSRSDRQPHTIAAETTRQLIKSTWSASPQQERIWFLQKLSPESSAYNLGAAFTVTGDLNLSVLAAASRSIYSSEPVLRSVFHRESDALVTAESEATQPLFRSLDLQYSTPLEEEALQDMVRQEMSLPFELEKGPLWRITVIRISPNVSLLVCVLHHILIDLWSMRILAHNLFDQYERIAVGSTLEANRTVNANVPFTASTISHAKFSEELEDLQYWKQNLADLPSPLSLAPGQRRPLQRSDRTTCKTSSIEKSIRDRVRQFARELQCTEFAVLLGAYALLLRRYSGASDIIIATPFINRDEMVTRYVIGLFAEPIPLRIRIDKNSSVEDLITQVKAKIREANAHKSLSFAKLVELLAPERIPGVLPIAQAFMGYYAGILQSEAADGLVVDPLDVLQHHSAYDVSLDFSGNRDRLSATLRTNAELFDSDHPARLLDDYINILFQMTSRPDASLDDFASVTEAREAAEYSEELLVAATFTAEPVAEFLEFWAAMFNLSLRLTFAPVSRIRDLLLARSKLSVSNLSNIFLIRLGDWVDGSIGLNTAIDEFLAALKTRAESGSQPFIVCVCPTAPAENTVNQSIIQAAEKRVIDALEVLPNVSTISGYDLIDYYRISSVYDDVSDKIASIPYTDEVFAALGTAIFRRMLALRAPRMKLVVCDGDNTLWDGVVGEQGVNGIYFSKKTLALHQFLLTKKRDGILLCLCSKNEDADVVAIFARHLESKLHLSDFVTRQVNWDKKSGNISKMALELNLGLENILFIDDEPIECAEVGAHCAGISALALTKNDDKVNILKHYWPLDRGYSSGDRTQMYLAERERRENAARLGIDFAAFIESLEIKRDIRSLTDDDLARVAELLLRTTQFNTTGFKATPAQLRFELEQGTMEGLTTRLTDKFGDYGLIGATLYRLDTTGLVVSSMLVSCRALGRGVENGMTLECARRAREHGLDRVVFRFTRSARNRPAEEFISELAATLECEWLGEEARLPVDRLLSMKTASARSSRTNAVVAEDPTNRPRLTVSKIATNRYEQIARSLNAASAILRAARATGTPQKRWAEASDYERSPLEKEIASIWNDLIGVEISESDVGFFEAGGDSLKAVRVLSRIESRFGVTLPILSFFESKVTVASLASAIEAELSRKI